MPHLNGKPVRSLHRDSFAVLYDAEIIGQTGPLDFDTYLKILHLLLSIAGDLHGLVDERLAELGHTRRVLAAVAHFPTIPIHSQAPAVIGERACAGCALFRSYLLVED